MSLREISSNLSLCEEAKQDNPKCPQISKRNPLHKDPEIWSLSGDCAIYLYKEGQSLRGPAFRVSRSLLIGNGCISMLKACCRHIDYSHTPCEPAFNVFLPAPEQCSRAAAYNYHCTTRNVFRCLLRKPLVGCNLGALLIDVAERLQQWNGSRSCTIKLLSKYIDIQSHSVSAREPEAALANLQFAEYFELDKLWIDAFVHCAGMWPAVRKCVQYKQQSRGTQELLSRARIEMEIRLEAAQYLLTDFDTLPLNLYHNLTSRQYQHIERFAEFLSDFSNALGGDSLTPEFDQAGYLDMRYEFQNLYEYLADHQSSTLKVKNLRDAANTTVYNLTCFNASNSYKALPYMLPILPERSLRRRSTTYSINSISKSLPSLKRNGSHNSSAKILLDASNDKSTTFRPSLLVYKYSRFEQYTLFEQDKIPAQEARLLDWTVIYTVLQTLIWVTSAPDGVCDVANINYPLCCNVEGIIPWRYSRIRPRTASILATGRARSQTDSVLSTSTLGKVPTRPRYTTNPRPASVAGKDTLFPLELVPLRKSSHGQGKRSQHQRSVRDPFLISSQDPERRHHQPSYVEILVPHYGNGMYMYSGMVTSSSLSGDLPQCGSRSPRDSLISSRPFSRSCSESSIGIPSSLPSLCGTASKRSYSISLGSNSSFYSQDSSSRELVIETSSTDGASLINENNWKYLDDEIENILSKVTVGPIKSCA